MKGMAKYFNHALLIGSALFLLQPIQAKERLYVFYPSVMRTHLIQKKLTQALPGIDVTVFGRYRDFRIKTKTDSPDAILSKSPVIKQLTGYTMKQQGLRDNNSNEAYVLVSVGKYINPAKMTGMSIGVFDILGRKGMKKFIRHYFRAKLRLKRVSKMEDLLQLLTFNMVDAILIPQIYVNYFKTISKLNFVITPVPNMEVNIAALAVGNRRYATHILRHLTSMNEILEINNWQEVQ